MTQIGWKLRIIYFGLHSTWVVEDLIVRLPHVSTHHLVVGLHTFVWFQFFHRVWGLARKPDRWRCNRQKTLLVVDDPSILGFHLFSTVFTFECLHPGYRPNRDVVKTLYSSFSTTRKACHWKLFTQVTSPDSLSYLCSLHLKFSETFRPISKCLLVCIRDVYCI